MSIHRFVVSVYVCIVLTVIGSGCSIRGSEGPQPDLVHTVSFQGETLALIAKWYTGDAASWRSIEEYNPGIKLRNLQLGDTIRIPVVLLKRKEALPRDVVESHNARLAAAGAAISAGSGQHPHEIADDPDFETKDAVGEISSEEQKRDELLRRLVD